MRETLQLTAEPRTKLGKGPSYQSRNLGRSSRPSSVYGSDADPGDGAGG